MIVDGSNIQCNNIADITIGMPISFANPKVHTMVNGDVYDIETHSFIDAKYSYTKPDKKQAQA